MSLTNTSLGIKETQIPLKMGWMESKHTRSALARQTFSAPAEPQATHPIFPSPHRHICHTSASRQKRIWTGYTSAQQGPAELRHPHQTHTGKHTPLHQLPGTPAPGMLGLEETLDFSSNYRDMVTQNGCVKDILPRIHQTETEEPLKQSWHVLLMKFLVNA